MHDVILAPKEARKLSTVILPRPQDGGPQQFLYDEINMALYEIIKYQDTLRSWFIDDQLESDGHFHMLTKVDPLFIFVPQLMKYAKEQFRMLDDVCQQYQQDCEMKNSSSSNAGNDDGDWLPKPASSSSKPEPNSPKVDKLDFALSPEIKWENVCDTKAFDDTLLVRFSETKTIDWLTKKHSRVMKMLEQIKRDASKATLISLASDHISKYVPDDLVSKFRNTVRAKYYESMSTNGVTTKTNGSSNSSTKANPPTKRAAPVAATASGFAPKVGTKSELSLNPIMRKFLKK